MLELPSSFWVVVSVFGEGWDKQNPWQSRKHHVAIS